MLFRSAIFGTEISTNATGISCTGTVYSDSYYLYNENNTNDIALGASTHHIEAFYVLAPTSSDSGANNRGSNWSRRYSGR